MSLEVLRIGHRPQRDKRITTHVGLVARAFGASGIMINRPDEHIADNLNGLAERFGGDFAATGCANPRKALKDFDGISVHLTMYGEDLRDVLPKLKKRKPEGVMVVVGAEKVPREIYELSTFNVSVGHQPHSEVAALAILLDRLTGSEWEQKRFAGNMEILPCKRGKNVIDKRPKNFKAKIKKG